jgi:hypothetical protein
MAQLQSDFRREGPFYAVYDGKIRQGDRLLARGDQLDTTGLDLVRLRALHMMNEITCDPPERAEGARGGGTAPPVTPADKRAGGKRG